MAKPIRVQVGALDEGRVQSTIAIIVAGYGSKYAKTQEERQEYQEMLNQRLKDPMTRLNLFRALYDTLAALAIYGMIRIVYPEEALDNMNDQDW